MTGPDAAGLVGGWYTCGALVESSAGVLKCRPASVLPTRAERDSFASMIASQLNSAPSLAAENARLKAALRDIAAKAETLAVSPANWQGYSVQGLADEARAALKGGAHGS